MKVLYATGLLFLVLGANRSYAAADDAADGHCSGAAAAAAGHCSGAAAAAAGHYSGPQADRHRLFENVRGLQFF